MYDRDVPIICAAMRAHREVFVRGVMFALLSARVQFPRVPEQCRELHKRGADAACLWGWKFDAYAYVIEHSETLWLLSREAQRAGVCIGNLCAIPGMGIVKGAFVAQMLGHDVACIDVRNQQRLGLRARAWRSDGEDRKTAPAFGRKIARYVEHTQGRARELWNDWCDDAGSEYGMSGERVSAMHRESIVPKRLWDIETRPMPFAVESNEIPF